MSKNLTIETELRRKSPELYDLYEKLKKWSFSLWTDHNDVYEQIRHGVSHSDALMEYGNTILQKKLKDGYLNEKELFLLASAIYLHDIGMQTDWKQHLGIQGDRGNLSSEERKKIRMNHAQTSGAVIRAFKNNLPDFLVKGLNDLQKGVLSNDLNDRLAFIVESHNAKGIAAHLQQVPVKFPENTLKIGFLAALLQFCDTMHMDKSRLNEDRFLDEVAKWEAAKPLEASYEAKDWQRFFQSYYVESVQLSPIKNSDVFEIQVNVKFNPSEPEVLRDRFLNIYKGRLERRKHDCLEVLGNHGIRFTGDNPFKILESESAKKRLPECFVALLDELESDTRKTGELVVSAQIISEKSLPNKNDAEVISRYDAWLSEITRTYIIPGIKYPPFSVDKCWLPLSAIELPVDAPPPQSPSEALDQYMKTGRNQSGQGKKYDAEWMGIGLGRIVLVGGPGSGKSLLLQRIAYRETLAGTTVVLAKLKLIASEMRKEMASFEEALFSVALEGSGFNDDQKRIIAQDATLLLLDGLDECGNQRNAIAAELIKWAAAHPEITIIVTTRPIGHAPASLPQWPHYLLNSDNMYSQSFSKFAIDDVCREVFGDRKNQIGQVEKRLLQVIYSDGWENKDKDYKFIRDVPLLFSFVISLAVHGCDIPDKRIELYRDIIKLLARDDVQDRGVETQIEVNDAFLFLHCLAWLLMKNPTCEYETLMQMTVDFLAEGLGIKRVAARKLSEQAFRFWEERRLLERLHHGAQELVTFMHLGFCEYAAAQHLATLSAEQINDWVVTTRNDPRWKEVYLNAASLGLGQGIVAVLLKLDSPLPPDTDEAIFAAEIAASSATINDDVLQLLLQNLMHRLTSGYPTRICKAAEVLLPLARKYPQMIGSLLKPLRSHEDEWSRYAALALCLEAGKEYIDLNELKKQYPDFLPRSNLPSSPLGGRDLWGIIGPHELKSAVLIGATKVLLSEGVDQDLLARIPSVYELNLSIYQSSGLSKLLKDSGDPKAIKISEDHEKKFWEKVSIPRLFGEEDKTEQLRFLDLMLTACSGVGTDLVIENDNNLIHLAKIVHVLRLYEMPAGNFWESLLAEGKEAQAQLVIRGAMLAVEVEPLELALDIVAAKKTLQENEEKSFFSFLPTFPIKGDWSKCCGICDTEIKLLASTIVHPSDAFAFAAAEIIAAGNVNESLREALTEILNKCQHQGLYIPSLIADHVWDNNALDVVLSRLEQELTSGCAYLLKKIPELSGGKIDKRIIEVTRRALASENEKVAQEAAELCLELIPKEELLPELKDALLFWKTNEKPYPTAGGTIPSSPRSSLVEALLQRNGLSTDEIISLYDDVRSDVKAVARAVLQRIATNDPTIVSIIIDMIETGRFKAKDLLLLTDLPYEAVFHEKKRLLGFLDSEIPEHQVVMIAKIKTIRLLSEIDEVKLLQQKLCSTNVDIREAARRALH